MIQLVPRSPTPAELLWDKAFSTETLGNIHGVKENKTILKCQHDGSRQFAKGRFV